MTKRIDRYVFSLILVPLVGTLVVAAMLLVLDRMLRLFDFVINEGGPVSVVWRMLGNLLPEYLSLGIPIGVMLGILLAFRRLAMSSELDTLLAVGVSYKRLLRVPFMFAMVFAVANFFIVGWLQPVTRYAYENLRFELRSCALGASIKVGEFANLGGGMTLRVEESRNQGADLRGLFVRVATKDSGGKDGQVIAATAARGTFLATDDPEYILLRLREGTLVHSPRADATPRVLGFAQHDLPIRLPDMATFRKRGEGNLEATLPELLRTMLTATDKQEQRSASASFNRRIVQCVIMFVLPFLAMAMAVPPKRSTSALGVFLSIIALVTFHKFTEYGERMGTLGRVDPVLAQWVPYALFLGMALWLFRVLERPGGQPIGALDRWFGKITGFLSGLAGKLVRRQKWSDDVLSAG